MSDISSITKGPRQTNIELLRIVAMFLVLTVHADFSALGVPTTEEFSLIPVNAWIRTIIESIAIVCVNVFILISGWFAIKFSLKGLLNFIFQCAFFMFGIYSIVIVSGSVTITVKGVLECFCLIRPNWFITSYVGLYLLAPVLNSFVELVTKKQFQSLLICFFVFQTFWGWSGAASWIFQGYGTFSFIGLYLLARYLRLYGIYLVNICGGAVCVFTVVSHSLHVRFYK